MKICRIVFQFIYLLLLITSTHAGEAEKHNHDEAELHIELSPEVMAEFDVQLAVAGSGTIKQSLELPGEVVQNPERLIHIVPRVPGITREVFRSLGEEVSANELLAVLASRELAELRAELDAAASRSKLAHVTFDRENKLKNEGLTSEREFLDAKQRRDEARIDYELAREKLQAIGITGSELDPCNNDCDPALYEIRSPREGVIIEKHIVRGELLNESSRPFVIADLDQVWVLLTVYQKDLSRISIGQQANIVSDFGIPDVTGEIVYISPYLSEQTRSATARIVISNEKRLLRPGQFVTAYVTLSEAAANIIVPKTALQTIDEQTVVFVYHDDELIIRPVQTGMADEQNIEITNGLSQNETYVALNAFVLKSQLQKGSFGHGHAH